MSTNTLLSEFKRNCPSCGDVKYYKTKSAVNVANRNKVLCRSCAKKGMKFKKNHPEIVTLKCEGCEKTYEITWKYRKQRFCSLECARAKPETWTTSKCEHCGQEFDHYILAERRFCSQYCNHHSDLMRGVLKDAVNLHGNPFTKSKYQVKARRTKLEKHGNEYYNNMPKNRATCMKNHGVPYGLLVGAKSNGKRVSKPQLALYEQTKEQYPDAILEHGMSDIKKSVDIFIPSQNRVIELYGNYGHCNPNKYKPDFYHKNIKLTAREIGEKDKKREQMIIDAGYLLDVVGEK